MPIAGQGRPRSCCAAGRLPLPLVARLARHRRPLDVHGLLGCAFFGALTTKLLALRIRRCPGGRCRCSAASSWPPRRPVADVVAVVLHQRRLPGTVTTMTLRFTPTLAICAIGAAVTGALLALPPAGRRRPARRAVAARRRRRVGAGAGGDRDRRLLLRRIANRYGGCRRTGDQRRRRGAHPDRHERRLRHRRGRAGRHRLVHRPGRPGTYEFICEIHPSMTGSLVVG